MKVTIITVCLNSEEFISNNMNSVDSQSWKNIEHIIIDGCSTDSTLEIIKEHYKPYRILIHGPDMGIYDAMNKGIKAATGEIIGFLNSDDYFASNESVTQLVKSFNQDVDCVWANLNYVSRDKITKTTRNWKSSNYELGACAMGWIPPHPTFYVKKEIYSKYGNYDLRFKIASDFHMMTRLLEIHQCKFNYIDAYLVCMRNGGVSNKNIKNIIIQNIEIYKSLKTLGIRINLILFILNKIIIKFKQKVYANRN